MLRSFRVFTAGFAAAAVILSSIWIYTEVANSNPSSGDNQVNGNQVNRNAVSDQPLDLPEGQKSPAHDKQLRQVAQFKRQLGQLEKTNLESHRQLSQAKKQLKIQSRKQKSIQQRIASLEKELSDLQSENEQLHADLGQKDKELAGLRFVTQKDVQASHRTTPNLIQKPRRVLSINEIRGEELHPDSRTKSLDAREIQTDKSGPDRQSNNYINPKPKAVYIAKPQAKKKPLKSKKISSKRKYNGRWVQSGKFFVRRGRLCKRYSMKPSRCFNRRIKQRVLTLRGQTCRVHKGGRIFCLVRHG